MIGRKYLLDTVVIIAYFNQDDAVRQRLLNATVYTSSIVLGELYFGAYHSGKIAQNIARIQHFATLIDVLPCDDETSVYFGEIKQHLKAKGRPIPENDIWIGATARQYGLTIATRDAHFQDVDDLSTDTW
jgi:tRNA(fMet)-specific endonuclease VapC